MSPQSATDLPPHNHLVESEKPESAGTTNISTPDQPTKPTSGYDLPFWRKCLILFVVSWMTLAATFSISCIYPATEEIAAEFHTTSEAINISNAGALIAASTSSLIWVPLTVTFGRRISYNLAILVLLICSILTAVSRNMAMFTAMRVLSGFEATFQQVAGQTFIADVFDAKFRGTAVGCFMVGSVLGPALGPLLGGVIVTYASWRCIFWTQTGMVAIGFALSLLFVPTIPQKEFEVLKPTLGLWARSQARTVKRTFSLLLYPNVFLADLACALLGWHQYSFLASPRYLINPRFHLDSALVSGLFYIAPGAGFILGSVMGGKYSDITMAKSIKARGHKVAQDRLRSGYVSFFLILPAATLVYGWCLEYEKGGLAIVLIAAFVIGFGMMAAFSSLNTYTAEVIPGERMAVISTKYLLQYSLGAAPGNAAILPMINAIGIGATETISACFVIVAGLLCLILARYGTQMQAWTLRHTRTETT